MTNLNDDTVEQLIATLQAKEQSLGSESPDLAPDLERLAEKLILQKDYDRAKQLLDRAMKVHETSNNYAGLRGTLHRLGWLCWIRGEQHEAEPYFQHALQVDIVHEPQSEAMIAQSAKLLTAIYLDEKQYELARSTLLSIPALRNRQGPPSTYYQAYFLLVLAVVCRLQEDTSAAREYAEQAAQLVKDKCATGYLVDDLALSEIVWLYYSQDRIVEAEDLVFCTLLENEDTSWICNLMAGRALARLAEFFRAQRKFKHAESVYKRAITVFRNTIGEDNCEFASLSLSLSNMYLAIKKYAEAEPPLKSAMKARVKVYGVEHPCVASCVETYSVLLRRTKRVALANKLESRAREIRTACVAKFGS